MKKYVFYLLALAGTISMLIFFKHSLRPISIHQTKTTEPKSETPSMPTVETMPTSKTQLSLIDVDKIPEKEFLAKIVAASPMITGQKMGTGFLVSRNGFILTDLHVTRLYDEVTVTFYNLADDHTAIEERLTVKGAVVQWSSHSEQDLALIKVNPNEIPEGVVPLELAENQALNKPQPLFRFGYNDGYRWTYGFFTPNLDDAPRSRVLMPVAAGASGGPIINMLGQVVGILQQGKDGGEEIIVKNGARRSGFVFPSTFFLPIDEINSFISGRPLHKKVKQKSAP